jgi:hypothetical protein
MGNLKDILKLAEAAGGKFFVIGDDGELKLVILPAAEYEQLMLGKLRGTVAQQRLDVDRVNQLITDAQLTQPEPAVETPAPAPAAPQVSVQALGEQALELREEAIDPSFDFEGPKVTEES